MISTEKQNLLERDCHSLFEAVSPEELSPLRNSTLLILGASGFLGSWITTLITYLNDNFGFNTQLILQSRHIKRVSDRNTIRYIEGDIRDIHEFPSDTQWVVHAAASPDARVHISDPVNTLEILSNGTSSILSASIRLASLKKFLYVSSGLVYGAGGKSSPFKEDQVGGPAIDSITSIYAEGKRFAETLVTSFRSLYKIPSVIVRPFTFLGPFQELDKPWAINNFIRDALHGGPIRIIGSEHSRRSFMYGSDFAFWTLKTLVHGEIGKSYNIGSPTSFTMLEAAQKVSQAFNSHIQIEFCNSGSSSVNDMIPDVSLAMESLQLKSTVDLDSAIKKAAEWYKLQR